MFSHCWVKAFPPTAQVREIPGQMTGWPVLEESRGNKYLLRCKEQDEARCQLWGVEQKGTIEFN